MKTFLEYVAEDIIQKYGTNLSRTAVVFPNKRAALFLNEHLVRLESGVYHYQRTVSPSYTIDYGRSDKVNMRLV